MEIEVLKGHRPVSINKRLLNFEEEELVPVVVTATKPDFYKQAPLIPAFEKVGLKPVVLHTG